jgi:hypothetical protein
VKAAGVAACDQLAASQQINVPTLAQYAAAAAPPTQQPQLPPQQQIAAAQARVAAAQAALTAVPKGFALWFAERYFELVIVDASDALRTLQQEEPLGSEMSSMLTAGIQAFFAEAVDPASVAPGGVPPPTRAVDRPSSEWAELLVGPVRAHFAAKVALANDGLAGANSALANFNKALTALSALHTPIKTAEDFLRVTQAFKDSGNTDIQRVAGNDPSAVIQGLQDADAAWLETVNRVQSTGMCHRACMG